MRFGLYLADLDRSTTRSQGIINYAVGLADALPGALAEHETLVVYANPAIAAELRVWGAPRISVRLTGVPQGVPGRLMLDHVGSVRAARRDRLDVLHFPKGFLPRLRPRGLRYVATVHDDIAVQYALGTFDGRPDRSPRARYFMSATAHTLRAADRLVTVSHFSRERLSALASSQGVPPPPFDVTYEASSLPTLEPISPERKAPWLLHFGSRLPHKASHDAVAWSLRYLTERGSDHRLLVTGDLDPATASLLRGGGGYHVQRVLSNADVAELLRRSQALLFTSRYEGFGLPPVEAYTLGTPAVFPRAGATGEILTGVPGGYDPASGYSSFATALDEVLSLSGGALAAARALLAQRYHWGRTAQATVAAYRAAAAERDRRSGGRRATLTGSGVEGERLNGCTS